MSTNGTLAGMIANWFCSTTAPPELAAAAEPAAVDVMLGECRSDCDAADAASSLLVSRQVACLSTMHLIGIDGPDDVEAANCDSAAASVRGVCVFAATHASANVSITE